MHAKQKHVLCISYEWNFSPGDETLEAEVIGFNSLLIEGGALDYDRFI